MQYRPEIDGLRALAVIPVILFHAGFETFSGGFVGVDVFFVISGYLITSIIVSDLKQNTFSITRFYERRARRILPALFLVAAVCVPFAYLWLLPSDLESFAKSLGTVIFFGSNFYFWHNSDYFSVAAELIPLLHTWSLAVEEQYYLIFPLVMLIIWRMGIVVVSMVFLTGLLLSLGLSEWASENKPVANFFLLPSRGWELLLGAIAGLALSERATLLKHPMATSALSLIGLIMIVISILSFDDQTPFPGVYALAPTFGTFLIILFANKQTLVGRLLSLKLLVSLGLISYSAYLWHHPILVFARHRSLLEPSAIEMLLLCSLTLPVAYLSWRYVEIPFRRHDSIPRRRLIGLLTGAASLLLLFSIFTIYHRGYEDRSAGTTLMKNLEETVALNFGLGEDCSEFVESCSTGKEKPKVLLWGDSFAMHLGQAIENSETRTSFQQYTRSACAPILDYAIQNHVYKRKWALECIAYNNAVLDWLTVNTDIRYVVLSSPFTLSKFDAFIDGVVSSYNFERSQNALQETIQRIQSLGVNVVLISPPPQNGEDLGRCFIKSQMFSIDPATCNFEREDFASTTKEAYALLQSVEQYAPVIWLDDLICDESSCNTLIDGVAVYRDIGHLSRTGSARLGQKHDLAAKIFEVVDPGG